MNITEIVGQLRAERERIDVAIRALEGVSGAASGRRRGRPPGKTQTTAFSRAGRRGRMSAEARKRIADAMKRRWAAAKKSGKKRL